MTSQLAITRPFSFDHSLQFIRRFPPCADEVIVESDRVTAAVSIEEHAHAFTVRGAGDAVVVDVGVRTSLEVRAELVRRAAAFLGTADDLGPFYAAAAGDRAMRDAVRALHGLHQVRFLGLEEIAVYCVMMQRTPVARAAGLKRRFLDRFGNAVTIGTRTLRAMPSLDELATLEPAAIAEAIGHRGKADRIVAVVRGVAAIGETFLRTARHTAAKDALLAVPGIGPFSAAAILLRGLGRVDELPSFEMFERDGRRVYGAAWDPAAIARRYGDQIGYWSFYLKTWAARQELFSFASASPTQPNRPEPSRSRSRASRRRDRAPC